MKPYYKHIFVESFNSIQQLLDTCDGRKVTKGHDNRNHGAWSGDTYEAARQMLLHGDAASVKSIKPAKVPRAESIAPRRGKNVAGYTPIVPLAIMNVPRNMRTMRRQRVDNKVLTLNVLIAYSCDTPHDWIEAAGKKLAGVIQSAEAAGYSITLYAVATFARDGDSEAAYTVRLKLKDASQPLDIKRLCYPLLHASFFRQILFDWYERYPYNHHLAGYGHALHYFSNEARANEIKRTIAPEKNARVIDLLYDDINAAAILQD